MIPAKNFFSGALGKTQNVGGSKIFTTPHTVNVKENYSINVGVNSKCITCSLDGKLWLFENSIVALKFNNETKRLEFAASKNIETEKFITRGLDWILTNNSIYLVTDEEPYLFSKNLQENTNAQRVLYSVLRSSVLSEVPRGFTNVTAGSGIDPFTKAAWGMNEDNGNSEGWGFFNKNNILLYPEGSHIMEQCYSLLPKVGDWQIVENFLIRRPDNLLENQSQLAPLIPLEFNGYMLSRSVTYPTYGTGYNLNHRGIQLFIHNGELWARGLMHIGKVSILPAVFHEDGTIKDYYLYISPEYILSPYNQRTNPNMDANNEWLKLNFISTKNNELLGFKSEQNNGLCSVSSDGQIFNPDNNEWSSPVSGENGKLVFDTVNSSALFLGNEGIKFLSNDKSFSCKALSQWVAPANQIESVSDDLVISSFDNHTLATCIPTGFNRELLSQRNLHLSARPVDGKRLSMGFSSGNITVNEISVINARIQDSFSWNSIYKNALNLRLLNIITIPSDMKNGAWSSKKPLWLGKVVDTKWKQVIAEWNDNVDSSRPVPYEDLLRIYWITTEDSNVLNYFSFEMGGSSCYPLEIASTCYFINPNNGELNKEIISLDITQFYDMQISDIIATRHNYYYEWYDSADYWDVYCLLNESSDFGEDKLPALILDSNNNLGFDFYISKYNPTEDNPLRHHFIPVISSSLASLSSWINSDNNGFILNSLNMPTVTVNNAKSNNLACYLSAIFNEVATNTKFAYELPSCAKVNENGIFSGIFSETLDNFTIYNYSDSNSYKKDYRNRNRSKSNLHLVITGDNILVFRSDLNSDVFDFDNELLRSVVS